MTILDASLERDLAHAASLGEVERVLELLAAGVNPSVLPSGCPFPALHSAAERGHVSVVDALLAHGCPVDLLDSSGTTALAIAVHAIADLSDPGDRERLDRVVVTLLKAGASPKAGRNREDAPLVLARDYRLADLESLLLRYSETSEAVGCARLAK